MLAWERTKVVPIDENERLHLYAEQMRDFAEQELKKLPFSLRYGKKEIAIGWMGVCILAVSAVCFVVGVLAGWDW